MQDIKPWIWTPSAVHFSASVDGDNFERFATVLSDVDETDETVQVERFTAEADLEARFLKIEGIGRGSIPQWHLGRGNGRWVFLDEIEVKIQAQ